MNATVQSPTSTLPGFNVLVQGPTGTGKTYSLGTLVDSGLDTYYIGLERGRESLLGYWSDRGKPIPDNLHWHEIAAADSGFAAMLAGAQQISLLTTSALTKVEDVNKAKYNRLIKLIKCLQDFPDDRTGKSFGPVDSWGTDRCLVIDALTGVNAAAMSLVVGAKPIKSLPDWGIAMDLVEKLLLQLTEGCRCHFILLSHVERELDQVLGGVKITVGTLGQKLAGKIPPMFSDVILAKRLGKEFSWSTIDPQADLKTRNLPLAEGISPDFGKIVDKWKSRGGKF